MRWTRLLLLVGALALTAPARSASVIYDAIENVAPVIEANFATDLAALAAAKGVAITTTVTLYKRQPAEIFAAIEQNQLPGLGLYGERVLTQAKRSGAIRDNLTFLVADYFARGTDPTVLMAQLELAAETLLKEIDRLWSAGGGVYGAGEAERSIEVVIAEGQGVGVGRDTYEGRVLVRFPVNEEDTGLT